MDEVTQPLQLLDGTTIGVLGFVLASSSVIISKLFDKLFGIISNLISKDEDDTGFNDLNDSINKLDIGLNKLDAGINNLDIGINKLLEIHNITDINGVLLCYFPQKVKDDISDILEKLRDLEEKQKSLYSQIDRLAISSKEASNEINHSNDENTQATLKLSSAIKELTGQYVVTSERLKDIKDLLTRSIIGQG